MPLPEPIANAPDLWQGLELYYEGFLNLSTTRINGFGIGSISWISVQQYCQLMELDEDQTFAMHHHVREMDRVFLAHHNKK